MAAITEPGKKQPAAEARTVMAFPVRERVGLLLTELRTYLKRDIAP
jgi:hypothetical protein